MVARRLGTMVALLILVTGMTRPVAAAPRPNVVFILTDDQRWDTIDKKHSVDGITPVMPKVQSLLVRRNSTTSTATRSSSPTSPATRRTPG